MSPAVSSGKHGGVLSRLFLFNSGSELVPRMSPLVSSGRRGVVAGRLFRLNSGNELVARASLAVCLVKHDGRLGSLFRIAGNRTRSRSFRASLSLVALHSHTILTRRVQTGLSTAPHNAVPRQN